MRFSITPVFTDVLKKIKIYMCMQVIVHIYEGYFETNLKIK